MSRETISVATQAVGIACMALYPVAVWLAVTGRKKEDECLIFGTVLLFGGAAIFGVGLLRN